MSRVPRIRFKGFKEDWEQRKFIDIAETRRGLTYKPTEISEDGIRVLRSSNINEDTFVKGEDDVFVDRKAINIPFVQNGDILITSANGSSRLVGKHAIIREITDDSAVHGGFMLLATAKDPQFLNASMGASWYIKFINLFVAGGNGAIGNLNKNDLDEQAILVPYETEQELIGRFFDNLDHLITLHQSKSFGHILKVIAGYTLYWEQRKLGEIVVIERGGSPRPIEKYITELNDGLNWIKIGDAPTQGRYITKTSEKIKESGLSKTRQVFPGDLILSNSMSFGKPYIMGIEGCIHDGWLLIRDKNNVFDLKFLCHMLSTEYLLNQYKMFAAGSTVNNLNKELVGNASVRLPEMLEQNKIGKYLESLDYLITLHQLEPFKLIFKAIAYRIIDYAKSKPLRYIKLEDIVLIYNMSCMKMAYIRNIITYIP